MANAKVTALTQATSIAGTDVLYIVTTPGGTPASKKATLSSLLTGSSSTNLTSTAIPKATSDGLLADSAITMVVNGTGTTMTFASLGTSSKAIDLAACGLTGGDYLIYFSTSNFWDAQGTFEANNYVGSSGQFLTDKYSGYTGTNKTINAAIASNAAWFFTTNSSPTAATNFATHGSDVLTKAGHGITFLTGQLIHIKSVTTAGDKGFYRVTLAGTQTASTIAFVDSNPDTITDSGNGFVTAGFTAGQIITVSGSASNNGTFTIDTVTAGTLTLSGSDSLVAEGAGASVTLNARVNSVRVDRSLSGSDTNAALDIWKDGILFPGSDSSGQAIRQYGGTQDKPLQLGGSVNASTGHSLTSADTLIAGLLELNGNTFADAGFYQAADPGAGVTSTVGFTNASTAYVDGSGSTAPKGVTGAGAPTFAGWWKIYNGTSTVYVPYYSAIQ